MNMDPEIPVSRWEFNLFKEMVEKEHKRLKEKLEQQQKEIDMLMIKVDYLLAQPLSTTTQTNPVVVNLPEKPSINLFKCMPQREVAVTVVQPVQKITVSPLKVENVEVPEVGLVESIGQRNPLGMLGLRQIKDVVEQPTNRSYSAREDKVIMEFVKKNTNHGGKAIWKKFESSGLLPGRTFESLRSRYLRYLRKS